MKDFKELKELVKVELEKVWTRKNGTIDEKMVKFCLGEISGIVELEDGGFYCFKKPSIRTHFCFGYGQNGISTEEDMNDASAASENAKKKENFTAENMSVFDEMNDLIKFEGNVYSMVQYNRGDDVKLRSFFTQEYVDRWGMMKACVIGTISMKDRVNLKLELENQKKKFAKRLETYWKRFGSSKLRTWTYLVD